MFSTRALPLKLTSLAHKAEPKMRLVHMCPETPRVFISRLRRVNDGIALIPDSPLECSARMHWGKVQKT